MTFAGGCGMETNDPDDDGPDRQQESLAEAEARRYDEYMKSQPDLGR